MLSFKFTLSLSLSLYIYIYIYICIYGLTNDLINYIFSIKKTFFPGFIISLHFMIILVFTFFQKMCFN